MIVKVIEADLILPIVDIRLADVVLHGQIGYLLVDKHHLHVVPCIVRVPLAARVPNIKRASRAHRHALIRDAHIVEDLKFAAVGLRLTLHELDICYDVFNNRTGDLLLGFIEEFTLLDSHVEAVCEEKLLFFVIGSAALTLFGEV